MGKKYDKLQGEFKTLMEVHMKTITERNNLVDKVKEFSSEALKDIETMCNLDEHLYINYSITVAKIKKKWRDRANE